jgi:uncharacterized membrane protein YbaN (DUF454 family)
MPSKNWLLRMKPVYLFLAWMFFLIGALGAVLPVLPTTPFMLLALWCFSRSSDRFHFWLYHHRFFGPPLRDWERYQVIPLVAKVMAVSMMLISLFYLLLHTELHYLLKSAAAVMMAYGAYFILTHPSRIPHDSLTDQIDEP